MARLSGGVVSLLVLLSVLPAHAGPELLTERGGNTVVPDVRTFEPEWLARLKSPPGFKVNIFAEGLGEPRMLAVGEDGTVYVTRRRPGDVVALADHDGDGRAETRTTAISDLPGVHGIAIHAGRVYLCTVSGVYAAALNPGRFGPPTRILSGLPPGGRHPNRTLAVGPDGRLYITVGSTCNCCVEDHPESAAILRVRLDGSGREIFATGLRNTVGFGWHPPSGRMFGMDHGTDYLGDDFPPEELNELLPGRRYGWPFVYAKGQAIRLQHPPAGFDVQAYAAASTPSVLETTAHSSPLQMAFYTGTQFPADYRNDAFLAQRGSWNRKPPAGYAVARIRFDAEGNPLRFEPFLSGFLDPGGDRPWTFARPTGLAVARDGSLLIGCDKTGVIFRVSYSPS
jgi:glucose/arabinose dehydrogenase